MNMIEDQTYTHTYIDIVDTHTQTHTHTYIYIYIYDKNPSSAFSWNFFRQLPGHDFVFVGPLLDKAGATRAAGHKFHGEHTPGNATVTDVLSLAKAAKAAGRQVGHGGLFF